MMVLRPRIRHQTITRRQRLITRPPVGLEPIVGGPDLGTLDLVPPVFAEPGERTPGRVREPAEGLHKLADGCAFRDYRD